MNNVDITRGVMLLRKDILTGLGPETMTIRDYNELNRRFEAVEELANKVNSENAARQCVDVFDQAILDFVDRRRAKRASLDEILDAVKTDVLRLRTSGQLVRSYYVNGKVYTYELPPER